MFYPINLFLTEDNIEFITILYDNLNNEEINGKHFDFPLKSLEKYQPDEDMLSKILLINLSNVQNLRTLKKKALQKANDASSNIILMNRYLTILNCLITTLINYSNNDIYFNDTTKTKNDALNDLDLIMELISELGYYGYYIPKTLSLNNVYTIDQHVNIMLF